MCLLPIAGLTQRPVPLRQPQAYPVPASSARSEMPCYHAHAAAAPAARGLRVRLPSVGRCQWRGYGGGGGGGGEDWED